MRGHPITKSSSEALAVDGLEQSAKGLTKAVGSSPSNINGQNKAREASKCASQGHTDSSNRTFDQKNKISPSYLFEVAILETYLGCICGQRYHSACHG